MSNPEQRSGENEHQMLIKANKGLTWRRSLACALHDRTGSQSFTSGNDHRNEDTSVNRY